MTSVITTQPRPTINDPVVGINFQKINDSLPFINDQQNEKQPDELESQQTKGDAVDAANGLTYFQPPLLLPFPKTSPQPTTTGCEYCCDRPIFYFCCIQCIERSCRCCYENCVDDLENCVEDSENFDSCVERCTGCDCTGCGCTGCDCTGCDCTSCDFTGCDCTGCDCTGCDCTGCDCTGCDCTGCDCTGCDCTGCILRCCDPNACVIL